MRLVVDTNVIVSGLLWGGPPNRILKRARDGAVEIIACEEMVDEARTVLAHLKFSRRISDLDTSLNELVAYLMNLVKFVPTPESIPETIR